MTNISLSLPSKATWILSGTQDNIICLPKPLHIVGFLLILWNISKSTGQIARKFSRDFHVPPLCRYHDLAVSNKHALRMSCMHVGVFHSSTWQHRQRPSVASTSLQFLADRKLVTEGKYFFLTTPLWKTTSNCLAAQHSFWSWRHNSVRLYCWADYHVGQSQCRVQIKVTVKRRNTWFSVRKLL